MDQPVLQEGQWITVGAGVGAVVSVAFENKDMGAAEVVYLDGYKAIYEDIKWADGSFAFLYEGQAGGYADNVPRLARFVAQVKAGRYAPGQ